MPKDDGEDRSQKWYRSTKTWRLVLSQHSFQHGQVAGQADRDRREQDVEGHRERELDARQIQCFQAEHANPPSPIKWQI
jgi:hypothetical protein